MIRIALGAATLLLAACVGAGPVPPEGPRVAIDADFPDPAAITAADGTTYVYATQGMVEGRMANIQLARSRDLARWERLGDALPVKPAWASRTQDFWAPHVAKVGERWLLYYSAKPDAALADPERGLCLAVASAARPEGPFTDMGAPLLCGPGFVNIDPMLFADPASGRLLLYWGSGFGPIKVQEMTADGLAFAPGSKPVDLVAPVATEDPANYRRLVEGAWVTYREGWYYLFFSGDNCCGPKAHYAVMVARSRSATRPFAVKPGNGGVILEADARWIAPGHNALLEAKGETLLLYHAVDAEQPRSRPSDEVNTRRVMLTRRLVWKDGWPAVAD
ncbi:glycoside hydrolase family 43 protein [Erythrobacter sp. NE805]|uniref:glycoside hydrolase family 43 protein n=1 Tax=Erythrobacter sp. NE805 TaxID=3389875 RepID=UPI00396AF181